jgi:hypothetical protein
VPRWVIKWNGLAIQTAIAVESISTYRFFHRAPHFYGAAPVCLCEPETGTTPGLPKAWQKTCSDRILDVRNAGYAISIHLFSRGDPRRDDRSFQSATVSIFDLADDHADVGTDPLADHVMEARSEIMEENAEYAADRP